MVEDKTYNGIPISQVSDSVFYDLKGLDGLKGLSALPEDLQDEWIRRKKESGSIKEDFTYEDIDRVFRNNLYVNKFGLDEFKSKPKEERDAQFKNSAYKDTWKAKSFGQKDSDILSTTLDDADLSTKEIQKGLNSYYTEEEKLKEVENRKETAEYLLNPKKQEKESWLNYIGRLLYQSDESSKTLERDLGVNEPTTAILAKTVSEFKKDNDKKDKPKKEGLGLFKGIDAVFKVMNEKGIPVGTPWGTNYNAKVYDAMPNISPEAKYSDEQPEDVEKTPVEGEADWRKNTSLYKRLTKLSDKAVQKTIDAAAPSLTEKTFIESQPMTNSLVDLSVNGDEEQQKELKTSVEDVLNLSNYFVAFKDRKELQNYDYISQIEDFSMFMTDAKKYGESVAQTRLDARIRRRVANNQDFFQHFGNDMTNIFVTGDNSFIASSVMGLMSMQYAGRDIINSIFGYDTQYLSNFLTQDVKEKGNLNDYLYNPKYWQYVDQFNTFDPKIIADGLANNGVASTMDVYAVDGVNKWMSAQTLHEGLRMAKFAVGSAIVGRTAGLTAEVFPAFGLAASNFAITGANVLGIAESYGMQTVEQTLQQTNETINNIITERANEFADSQAKERTEDIQAIAEQLVSENTNLRKGQKGYKEAVDTFMEQAANLYKSEVAQSWAEEHSGDFDYLRNQAQKAAAAAYGVDFVVEGIRMANVVPTARKYLYTKSGRQWANARRAQKAGLAGVREVGSNRIAANVNRWKDATKTVINGFTSNYLDDVTVGLGKGAGVSMFNDYVARTTDPSVAAISYAGVGPVMSALYGGLEGAEDALTDPQSLYDGFIGGIGTVFSGIPSVKGVSNLIQKGWKKGVITDEFGNKRNVFRFIDQFVQNPVLSAYTQAVESEYNNPIVKAINESMSKDGVKKVFEDAGAARIASMQWDSADNLMERKDAEALNLFEVTKLLNKARTNADYSQVPQLQRLLQQLNDYAEGNITEVDVDAFLAQDENKSLVGEENGRETAKQRLQENAKKMLQRLQEFSSKYDELSEAFKDKNWNNEEREQIIESFVFEKVLSNDWSERLGDIEEQIKESKVINTSPDRRALYPTKELWEARKQVTREELMNQERLLEKSNRKLRSKLTSKEEKAAQYLNVKAYQENISELNKRLREIQSDEDLFDENGNNVLGVITADEILSLSPEDRLSFLVSFPLTTKEQQNETNIALTRLFEKYTEDETWEMLRDAAILHQNIDAANKSYTRRMEGLTVLPDYVNYRQSLRGREGHKAYALAVESTLHNRLDNIEINNEDEDGVKSIVREANTAIRSTIIPASKQIQDYIEKRQESKDILTPLLNKLKLEEALAESIAADENAEAEDRKALSAIAATSLSSEDLTNGINEAIQEAITNEDQHLADVLTNALRNAGNLTRQNKATKDITKGELSKRELDNKRKQEEFNQDGKNFGWDGYYVGQKVWDTNTGEIGIIQKFNASIEEGETGSVEVAFTDSKETKTITLRDAISSEKPTIDQNNQQTTQKTKQETPQEEIDTTPVVENPTIQIIAEDEIKPDAEGNWISPDEVVGGEEEKESIQQAENTYVDVENQTLTTDANAITGNGFYQYEITDITNEERGGKKLVERIGDTKYQRTFFNWIKENNIKYQDIVDNELGSIYTENPNIKLHTMSINPSEGKELSSLPILVVEYTKDVAKWHNKDRGGVLDANGKQWLVVGIARPAAKASVTSADYIMNRLKLQKNNYYKTHRNEKYFVSDDYTQIKEITSGRIVNQTLEDSESKDRSLRELLSSQTRNPENLSVEDLKFLVIKGNQARTIGITNEKVYKPKDAENLNGAVFVLSKAANGNYIPIMVSSSRYSEVAENSPVKERADNIISRIPSVDSETRTKAFQELTQMFVNTKNNGIHERSENQIVVIRDGEEQTFTIGKDFDLPAFLTAVQKADLFINLNDKVLNNKTLLKQYIDSGIIKTDAGLLGTVNASYSIYDINSEGKPMITAEISGTSVGKSDYKNTAVKIEVGNREYKRKGGKYYDTSDNEINRDTNKELYKNIYYNDIIQSRQLTGEDVGNNREMFIISEDLTNPEVVIRNIDGSIAVLPIQRAIDAINYHNQKIQEDLKVKVMQSQPKPQPAKQTNANEFKGKSLSELQSTDNLTTFRQIYTKGTVTTADGTQINVRQRLNEIVKAKGWDWGSSISQREAFLKSKEIQTDNITDIESWYNNIESCK